MFIKISSEIIIKRIQFVAGGKDLWDRAMQYLSSPVKHVLHTDAFFSDIFYCKSNLGGGVKHVNIF